MGLWTINAISCGRMLHGSSRIIQSLLREVPEALTWARAP